MSSAGKAASRYSSFDSQSSTSSSADLKHKPSLKHVVSNSNSRKINGAVISNTSRAKSNEIVKVKAQNEQNFGAMVKKFIEHRSNLKAAAKDRALPLIVPADFIAEDLKKTGAKSKGSKLAALPRKLFGKGSAEKETKTKALTEVRANTRTLAMVLRSERELLSFNKDQEADIAHLKSLLEERNHEVEKLKDLCLKQREEIKALKSAILFPDEMNSQLQELLERQGSELKQARQVIPTLQRQITSLTGQLRCLSDDLAEVKADKYPRKPSFDDDVCSPQAEYDQEEAANSLDFSAGDPMTPDSPDDMLLKDMNPCLTPCYSKIKSKEYETCSESPGDERFCATNFRGRKLSVSSDCGAKHHV